VWGVVETGEVRVPLPSFILFQFVTLYDREEVDGPDLLVID